MDSRFNRGAGALDAVLILGFVIFVMLVTPRGENTWKVSDANWLPDAKVETVDQGGSQSSISLSTGNAPYTSDAYKEYVALYNWGNTPVSITGWQLRNGKDKRTYDNGGSLQKFSADLATIPTATKLLYPNGTGSEQNVVLAPGERAIVTTGYFGVRSPVSVKSFKENLCTGYIEMLPEYSFEPSLDASCPSPAKEPGFEGLDSECRDFVSTLSSCRTPEFDTKTYNNETCTTCVGGRRLSSQCAAFVKEHFSYKGCLAYHSGDANFDNKNTWRIFLGRAWEMWSDKYETINVFDRAGTLVESEDY